MYTYIATKTQNDVQNTFIEQLRSGFTHSINIHEILDKISRLKTDEDLNDPKLNNLIQKLKIRAKNFQPFSSKKKTVKKEILKSSKINSCRKIFLLLLEERKDDLLIFTNFLLKYLEHQNEYLRELTFSIIEYVDINKSIKKQALMKEMENGPVFYLPNLVEEILQNRNLEGCFIENYKGGSDSLKRLLIPEILQKFTFHPKFYLRDDLTKIIGLKKLRDFLVKSKGKYFYDIKNYIIELFSASEIVIFEVIKTIGFLMKNGYSILEDTKEKFIAYQYKKREKKFSIKNKIGEQEIFLLIEKLKLSDQFIIFQEENLRQYFSEDIIFSLISVFHSYLINYLTEKKYLLEIFLNSSEEGKIKIMQKINFIDGSESQELLQKENNACIDILKLEIIKRHNISTSILKEFENYEIAQYMLYNRDSLIYDNFTEEKFFYQYFNNVILNSQKKIGKNPVYLSENATDEIDLTGPIELEYENKIENIVQLTPLTDMIYVEGEYEFDDFQVRVKLLIKNNSEKSVDELLIYPFSFQGNCKPKTLQLNGKEMKIISFFIPLNQIKICMEIQFFLSFNNNYIETYPLYIENEKLLGERKLKDYQSIWKKLPWENNLNLNSVNFDRLNRNFYLGEYKKFKSVEYFIYWNQNHSIINICKGKEIKIKIRSRDEESIKIISQMIKSF